MMMRFIDVLPVLLLLCSNYMPHYLAHAVTCMKAPPLAEKNAFVHIAFCRRKTHALFL